jgi:sulfate/thiosulfate transport system permease protein
VSGPAPSALLGRGHGRPHPTSDPAWARRLVIGVALTFVLVFVAVPLAIVFVEAFGDGASAYFHAITATATLSALKLTLEVAIIAVALNLLFGVAAAWCIARFRFPGRSILITLIDLPFAVSPVIAGLVFVLLFGAHGFFGSWLAAHHLKIIFATPGLVLATVFVTFPFVARELIPLMDAQGSEEEEAAIVLGASGWQTFFRVTLPKIKWGLIYGTILCMARAIGEYGAVAVVSGNVRGRTDTLPLHVETLYEEKYSAAFAVSSLLILIALGTLVLRRVVEHRAQRAEQEVLIP